MIVSTRKSLSKRTRQRVHEKFGGRCAYCGKEIDYGDMQVDHCHAVYKEGSYHGDINDLDNLFPSCRRCNFRKGTLSIEQFRQELIHQADGICERNFQVKQSIDYGLLKRIDKPIKFYFERYDSDNS